MFETYQHIKSIHIVKERQTVYQMLREDIEEKQLFSVGCIFKSFLSVLVGIAIEEGKIGSVEDCVISYCTYDEPVDMNWYKLKIKHALSKTTGIIWPGLRQPMPKDMNEIMKLKFETEPGVAFKYKPDPQIIVYLLELVYRKEITQLFKEKLVCHFKNQNYKWSSENVEGMQVSRELLDELGEFLLNKGVIGKKQLINEDYFQQCMHRYSDGGFPEGTAYGLGWWLDYYKGKAYCYAAGFGGQYLVVVPSEQLTISILSDMDRPHPENKMIIERILSECL